jgi:hypothetical protein
MNSNNSNDWTTVRSGNRSSTWGQPRQMPTAFSNGGGSRGMEDERAMHRRANAEAEAAVKAREARERREALEAARAKEKDATAFDSESAYPSLGAAASARPHASTLNFGRTVAAMAAREKAEEEARAAAAAASLEYAGSYNDIYVPSAMTRRRFIGTRCFDDGPEDYDGPEEDFGDDVSVEDADDTEDAEEDNGTGEFNAELATTRRRGDKNGLY